MDHCLPTAYRTVDPIDNMTVRVAIRKRPGPGEVPDVLPLPLPTTTMAAAAGGGGTQASAGLHSAPGSPSTDSDATEANRRPPLFPYPGGGAATVAGAAGPGAGQALLAMVDSDRIESVITFGWQQKVFGPRCVAALCNCSLQRDVA